MLPWNWIECYCEMPYSHLSHYIPPSISLPSMWFTVIHIQIVFTDDDSDDEFFYDLSESLSEIGSMESSVSSHLTTNTKSSVNSNSEYILIVGTF